MDKNIHNLSQFGSSLSLCDGTMSVDSFSRLRVGLPKLRLSTIFDTSKRPLFWDEEVTGAASSTHSTDRRSVLMEVTGIGKVIRQTKEYFVYRAGQSQLIFATFVLDNPGADSVVQRVGYYDEDDGLFLERTNSSLAFVVRTSTSGAPVETRYQQTGWNVDKLDGSGPSQFILNPDRAQILVINYQWLGVGIVSFGFDLDGTIVIAHQVRNANKELGVYMKTPKLPIRYEIEATGVPSAARTLEQICSTVIREGGDDEPNVSFEARNLNGVNISNVYETVLGIRLKSTDIRATIRLLEVACISITTDVVEYSVVLNPTYVGVPTWTSASPDSVAEVSRDNLAVNVTGTGAIQDGHIYPLSGYCSATNQSQTPTTNTLGQTVPLAADIAGNTDEIWLVARCISDLAATVRGTLSWNEER